MKRPARLVACVLGLLAGPATAEPMTFALMLGERQIGTLVFDASIRETQLRSTLDNTPLGVADGTFDAVTRTTGAQTAYLGRNRGGKTRDIAVSWQGDSVTDVTVTPQGEGTDLSDPAKVPRGALSPSAVFAALAQGRNCPSPMAMYDGRRVIQIGTTTATEVGTSVTCEMAYRVILGPGHLSPFRFRSVDMQAVYTSGALREITLGAGGFRVRVLRLD